MKTGAATTDFTNKRFETATGQITPAQRFRIILQRLRRLADAVTNFMRLIRAYNDLSRMNTSTLRDIGFRPGELDRVLDGRWKRNS